MICKAYEILLFLGYCIFFDTNRVNLQKIGLGIFCKNSHSSYAEFEIQQKLTSM